MKYTGEKLKLALDKLLIEQSDDGFRNHLGASLIGDDCTRKLFYTFRWASKPKWKKVNLKAKDAKTLEDIEKYGALLRLFQRGHEEEHRFVKYLRMLGCDVAPFADVATEKQWRIVGAGGHAGGSLDCIIEQGPKALFPQTPGVGEFKTHNRKSFDKLIKEGVASAKLTHYVQMQKYMGAMGYAWAIYVAVCKDSDRLHFEFVDFDKKCYDKHTTREEFVVFTDEAPLRISPSPSHWLCKFCDFYSICHEFEVPAVNCRTCSHATPELDGTWSCGVASKRAGRIVTIPTKVMLNGCPEHVFLPSLLNAEYLGSPDGRNIEIKLASGAIIKTGPDTIPSNELCSLDGISKKA